MHHKTAQTMIKLISPLHKEALPEVGYKIPGTQGSPDDGNNQVVMVMTGGTEGLFLDKVKAGEIDLKRPIYLVASGQSNSLAASLEILAYINQHGGKGEIVESVECRV